MKPTYYSHSGKPPFVHYNFTKEGEVETSIYPERVQDFQVPQFIQDDINDIAKTYKHKGEDYIIKMIEKTIQPKLVRLFAVYYPDYYIKGVWGIKIDEHGASVNFGIDYR